MGVMQWYNSMNKVWAYAMGVSVDDLECDCEVHHPDEMQLGLLQGSSPSLIWPLLMCVHVLLVVCGRPCVPPPRLSWPLGPASVHGARRASGSHPGGCSALRYLFRTAAPYPARLSASHIVDEQCPSTPNWTTVSASGFSESHCGTEHAVRSNLFRARRASRLVMVPRCLVGTLPPTLRS